MKAMVYHKYGSADVLKFEDVAMPTPKDGEVLIKIHAVSINGSDREGLIGKPLYARMGGLRKPSYPILGSDIAGHVEKPEGTSHNFSREMKYSGKLPDTTVALPSMPALLKRLLL